MQFRVLLPNLVFLVPFCRNFFPIFIHPFPLLGITCQLNLWPLNKVQVVFCHRCSFAFIFILDCDFQSWLHTRIQLGSSEKSLCPGHTQDPLNQNRWGGVPGLLVFLKLSRLFQCASKFQKEHSRGPVCSFKLQPLLLFSTSQCLKEGRNMPRTLLCRAILWWSFFQPGSIQTQHQKSSVRS